MAVTQIQSIGWLKNKVQNGNEIVAFQSGIQVTALDIYSIYAKILENQSSYIVYEQEIRSFQK